MEKNRILNEEQAGFRPNRSTQDLLLRATDDWKKALDLGQIVATVMIDLSKAFDTINHDLLLGKLNAYGIQGAELAWFTDYLSGRKQRVVLNSVPSEWARVTMGVPQGSILGPLLFLLFVNDLPDVVQETSINLFADDTAIYSADSDPTVLGERVEKDLGRVALWIHSNGLRLNVAKTQLMVLSRRGRREEADSVRVKIGEVELQQQSCVRYLGVEIDRDLTWKAHIQKVCNQCMGKLAAIRRAGSYLPCHIRKLLYQAFVLPHLDYCSVVWNSCGATLGKRIERVQNYALRLILRKPPLTSSELLRRTLGWTTLEVRRRNALVCQVHRCITNQAPSYFSSKFTSNSSLCTMQRLEVQPNYIYHILGLNFITQVLSFKVPRCLTIYPRLSESYRRGSYSGMPCLDIEEILTCRISWITIFITFDIVVVNCLVQNFLFLFFSRTCMKIYCVL